MLDEDAKSSLSSSHSAMSKASRESGEVENGANKNWQREACGDVWEPMETSCTGLIYKAADTVRSDASCRVITSARCFDVANLAGSGRRWWAGITHKD